jgi:RNA-splicing ligase RtcB
MTKEDQIKEIRKLITVLKNGNKSEEFVSCKAYQLAGLIGSGEHYLEDQDIEELLSE